MLMTLLGLLLVTFLMVGVRMLFMQTIQKRRERENRQINERLKTLIAAYKVLGGSFTGSLTVHSTHLRDLRLRHIEANTGPTEIPHGEAADAAPQGPLDDAWGPNGERQRRIRDAVEAALSDIVLLGTEEQVRLAALSAQDMVAGRPIETAALVSSLRQFIRQALDLEPIPETIIIPNQGPTRPNTSGAAGAGRRAPGAANGAGAGFGGRSGGTGAGMGMGLGMGMRHSDDAAPPS